MGRITETLRTKAAGCRRRQGNKQRDSCKESNTSYISKIDGLGKLSSRRTPCDVYKSDLRRYVQPHGFPESRLLCKAVQRRLYLELRNTEKRRDVLHRRQRSQYDGLLNSARGSKSIEEFTDSFNQWASACTADFCLSLSRRASSSLGTVSDSSALWETTSDEVDLSLLGSQYISVPRHRTSLPTKGCLKNCDTKCQPKSVVWRETELAMCNGGGIVPPTPDDMTHKAAFAARQVQAHEERLKDPNYQPPQMSNDPEVTWEADEATLQMDHHAGKMNARIHERAAVARGAYDFGMYVCRRGPGSRFHTVYTNLGCTHFHNTPLGSYVGAERQFANMGRFYTSIHWTYFDNFATSMLREKKLMLG